MKRQSFLQGMAVVFLLPKIFKSYNDQYLNLNLNTDYFKLIRDHYKQAQ
jgi:hypothetical protein